MQPSLARLVDTTRPLERPGQWWRTGAFAAVAMLALVVTALPPSPRWPSLAAAVVALAGIVAATGLPWRRWPRSRQALPLFGYFVVAGLLDNASGSQLAPVLVAALPVIWIALFHTRRVLLAALLVLAVAAFVPLLLAPAGYPDRPWGALVIGWALAVLSSVAIQQLVQRNRSIAGAFAESLGRARADRDLLDAYLASVGALVLVLDVEGRVTLFNRFTERVTGHDAYEFLGEPLWSLMPHPESFRERFAQVAAGAGPATFEGLLRTIAGEYRRVSWVLTAMTNDAGDVLSVIAAGQDVTEQRATERLFAKVLEAATQQMIFATDMDGVFTAFNSGGQRLLGYTPEELIGVARADIIHRPEDMNAVTAEVGVESFRELLHLGAQELPSYSREWQLVRKDGTEVPAALTINPMRDEDGAVIGYVGVAWDITAQRETAQAQAQALERERSAANHARELDQVKNDFVAMVSHDLRTPLTSIVGNTELILDGDAGPLTPPQRRLLEAVDRNSRRLDSLVGDLLLLSRIESGTLRLHARVLSVAQVVDGALEALAGRRSADVDVVVVRPDEPVLVRGDPDQLERVAINLIGNALKFTPPGGQVTVSVDGDESRAVLRVSDTGIGIPEEELPHVFDRFFRSSRSRDRDRPGTGLGLTIAKSIVEQHQGRIQATVRPGGGTVFAIDLPRLPTSAEVGTREPA